MVTLTPEWEPIPFPAECAPFGEALFEPVQVPEEAVLVAGGPSRLCFLHLTRNPYLDWTFDARVRIAGFAVHGGTVYIQDGPVLSYWHLTSGACLGAVNLVVADHRPEWSPAGGSAWDESAKARVYGLPPALKARQDALVRARRMVEWLRLREDLGWLWPDVDPRGVSEADSKSLSQCADELSELLMEPPAEPDMGSAWYSRRIDILRALWDAEADASTILFSAPVVRRRQLYGNALGMVFVLGADGTLHALGDDLAHLNPARAERLPVAKLDRPLVPALGMAELRRADADEYECRLFYLGADGLVHVVDGDAHPPRRIGSWGELEGPDAMCVLLPRFADGLVWCGGPWVGGPDTVARSARLSAYPAATPGAAAEFHIQIDTPPGRAHWRDFDLLPEAKLLLYSDGLATWGVQTPGEAPRGPDHLRTNHVSYAATAAVRERWAAHVPPEPSWTLFWPSPTTADGHPRPASILEVGDRAAPAAAGLAFRLYAANTVDAAVTPTPLASGTLGPWSAEGGAARRLRARPVLTEHEAFVIARSPSHPEVDRIDTWSRWHAELIARRGSVAAARAHIAEEPLPPLPVADALFAYSLAELGSVSAR